MRGAGPTLTGMRELQQRIIAQQGVLPEIDPAAEVERRVAFLADYLAGSTNRQPGPANSR